MPIFQKVIGAGAVLFLAAAFAGPASAAEELNWAQQLVRPIENTSVHHNETVNYGRYKFAAGPSEKGVINSVTTLEGKTSAILYKATEKNSVFEIFSVYKKYLKDNGFEIVFACEKEACGENFKGGWYDLNPFENNPGWGNSAPISSGGSYIAARKKSASGDIYVSVYASSGWWNYPSYRVDVAQVGDLETEVVPASRGGKAPESDFFKKTHIYNNDMSRTNSTFAVLEHEYSPDLERLKISPKAEYLFFIINGQQEPCYDFCFGQEGDRVFGQGLTGIHRGEGKKALNKHHPDLEYSIYNGQRAGTGSVAATLFNTYGDQAVIVDILNAKYEWALSQADKAKTRKYISDEIIGKIVKAFRAAGRDPKVFVTGFSRGGLLTYELSQQMPHLDIVAAVSIDPVINHLQSYEKGLVQSTAYFDFKANGWKFSAPSWKLEPNWPAFFPVLRQTNRKTAYYNVFQRKGVVNLFGDKEAVPMGLAVDGAKSPCDFEGFPCRPGLVEKPYEGPMSVVNQYDGGILKHTPDMLDTYAGWIIKIVQKHFPLPVAAVPAATVPVAAQEPSAKPESSAPPVSASGAPSAPKPVQPPAPEVRLVPVPDVRKKLYLMGKQILESQGFKVNKTGNFAGLISAQSPGPNTMVERGSTVTLTVGK